MWPHTRGHQLSLPGCRFASAVATAASRWKHARAKPSAPDFNRQLRVRWQQRVLQLQEASSKQSAAEPLVLVDPLLLRHSEWLFVWPV